MDDRTRMALGGLLGGLATGMTKAWEQNREALMKSQEFAWKAQEGATERAWKSGESELTRTAEKENLGTKLASEEKRHTETMDVQKAHHRATEGQAAENARENRDYRQQMLKLQQQKAEASGDAQSSRSSSAETRNQITALKANLSALTAEAKALTSQPFLDRGQAAQLKNITQQITAHREKLSQLGDVENPAPGLAPNTGGTPPTTNTGASFDPDTFLGPYIFKKQ